MQILDNINTLWGDDLKETLKPGAKLRIAASCFSIYAFKALKKELENVDVNNITPLQALQKLDELKKLIDEHK